MLENASVLFIGISFILMGIDIFFVRRYAYIYWRHYIYGKYHPAIGALFVIVGVIFIVATIRNLMKNKRERTRSDKE